MSRSSRLLAVVGVVALAASGLTGASPAHAVVAAKPGLSGTAIPLGRHLSMTSGAADMAYDNHGTVYAAWIATSESFSDRTVFLCVIPPGAPACKGGIQHIDSLGESSAEDIHVLMVKGVPTLLWMHDTANSINGPEGAAIATATVSSAGVLSAATDVQPAPSFGSLLDAEVAPNGDIWTLTYPGGLGGKLQLREGLSASATTVNVPYAVGFAHLAWDHGTAIIVIMKYGQIDVPVAFSSSKGTTFPAFKNVPHTGAIGIDFDLVNAAGHVRLITGRGGNADYTPVETTWNGHSFPPGQHTGYPSGYPGSHDGGTDKSGRLVDLSNDNGKLTVSNLADDRHAAIAQFASGGYVAGAEPQIATTARGHGWVMWGIEDGAAGDRLRVAPVRLAGRHHSVRKRGAHGAVSVLGPASCLPDSTIRVTVHGSPAKGWKVAKKSLHLGSKKLHTSLDGGSLAAGKTYTLVGSVVFASKSSGKHSTVTAKLKFRSCPN